jgi:hypothetical protein
MDGPEAERQRRRDERSRGDEGAAVERHPAVRGRPDRDAERDEDDRPYRRGGVAESAGEARAGGEDEEDQDGGPRPVGGGARDGREAAEDEVPAHRGGAQRVGSARIGERAEPSAQGHPEERGPPGQLADDENGDRGGGGPQAEGNGGTRRGHLHAGADVPQHEGSRLTRICAVLGRNDPQAGAVPGPRARSRRQPAGTPLAPLPDWTCDIPSARVGGLRFEDPTL